MKLRPNLINSKKAQSDSSSSSSVGSNFVGTSKRGLKRKNDNVNNGVVNVSSVVIRSNANGSKGCVHRYKREPTTTKATINPTTNEHVNHIEPQMVVNQRPKRQVNFPNLDGFYVEPQIKFTRLPKIKKQNTQKAKNIRPCIIFAGSPVAQNRTKVTKTAKKRPTLKDKQIVRQRKSKDYVYINLKDGKSNPITAVDRSLEKSIVAGKAKMREMFAFTEIPNVELSKLNRNDTGEGKNKSGLKATGVSLGNKVSEGNLENVKGSNYVDVENVEVDESSDDQCGVCGDGGYLVCCDGCSSTFHQSCLHIQNLPSGQWYCVYCLCKVCGALEAGNRHGAKSEMLSCSLCEGKFHESCVKGKNINSSSLSFCGRQCSVIYDKLQMKFGVKIPLQDGYSCTFVKRFDLNRENSPLKRKCNSKLANALEVLNKCFVPSIEKRTQTNMIEDIVNNRKSNLRRLDYTGFFTAILEKNDNMISVASLRIHGNKLAEMPYIGTLEMYRGKGMCGRLLDSIESVLNDLGVRKLVIPAIDSVLTTWINKYGFKPLALPTKKQMKSMSIVVFIGVKMLEKRIKHE